MNESEKLAKIAVNKSFLKEYSNSKYSRIVYLKSNSEFQIQLFNPNNFTIGVEVSIDNKELGNMLVIKPGERVWLERYLDSPNKFLFSTYEVNGNSNSVKKAIENNGDVNIKFYKEYIPNKWWDNQITWTYYPNNINDTIKYKKDYSNYNFNSTTHSISSDSAIYETTCMCTSACPDEPQQVNTKLLCSNKIETGRVEKGNYSNQKFKNVNVSFESYPFKTEFIKLFPESQKQLNSNDLKKQYCTNCGRKIKEQFKFCPYCGAKV